MQKGFTLIAVTITTAILLITGTYFTALARTDIRIAAAHASVTQAYYLAEAATAILIHAIINDETLTDHLLDGTLSRENSLIERVNLLEQGDAIAVFAESAAPGEAQITVQSNTPLHTAVTSRVTETSINRPIGSAITDFSLLNSSTDEDVEIKIDAEFEGGILQGNDDIEIQNGAAVIVHGGRVWARDEIRVEDGSTLSTRPGARREGVRAVEMPAIDFNSAEPTSWRNQATTIYSTRDFNRLRSGTVLEGIIYVDGTPADLQRDLTVIGLLVINGDFEIEDPATLRIDAPAGNAPAGLLVLDDLEIESNTIVDGLIYAGDSLEIEYDDDDTEGTLTVTVDGGIIARKIEFKRDQEGPADILITHNENLLGRVLNDDLNLSAPILEIGHWEEAY